MLIGDQLLARARGAVAARLASRAGRAQSARRSPLLSVGLNVGIAAANLAAGALNDAFAAGAAIPRDTRPMMLLFAGCGAAGFAFALRLWIARGQHP